MRSSDPVAELGLARRAGQARRKRQGARVLGGRWRARWEEQPGALPHLVGDVRVARVEALRRSARRDCRDRAEEPPVRGEADAQVRQVGRFGDVRRQVGKVVQEAGHIRPYRREQPRGRGRCSGAVVEQGNEVEAVVLEHVGEHRGVRERLTQRRTIRPEAVQDRRRGIEERLELVLVGEELARELRRADEHRLEVARPPVQSLGERREQRVQLVSPDRPEEARRGTDDLSDLGRDAVRDDRDDGSVSDRGSPARVLGDQLDLLLTEVVGEPYACLHVCRHSGTRA